MYCWRAQNSNDQVLVLCSKKEFKGKTNSKWERTDFINVKVHTQERSVGKRERQKERQRDTETQRMSRFWAFVVS